MPDQRPATPAEVLLTVPGPPLARAATHIVGVLAILSLLGAALMDAVAVAVASAVLGGVTLARVLALPGAVQAPLGLSLMAAAWASKLDLYVTMPWIDIPAHLVVNGLLAAALGIVLVRAEMVPDADTRAGRAGIIITTTGVGVVLAVLWEIAEWAGFTYIDESIYVYYGDTIGDLAAGAAGSAVAGFLVARWAAR